MPIQTDRVSNARVLRALDLHRRYFRNIGTRVHPEALGLRGFEESLVFENVLAAAGGDYRAWQALSPERRWPAGGMPHSSLDFDFSHVAADLPRLTPDERALAMKVLSVGQGKYVFEHWRSGGDEATWAAKRRLLSQLRELDDFYGIARFQARVYELVAIAKKGSPTLSAPPEPPQVIDVRQSAEQRRLRSSQIAALLNLEKAAVGLVAGGVGKRFGEHMDEKGESIPKALFEFGPLTGKTFLRLQAEEILALENLRYLTIGDRIAIPYIIMTSPKEGNDRKMRSALENDRYYGLDPERVETFNQVLVPLVDENANWMMASEYEINANPHGHGDWNYGIKKEGLAYRLLENGQRYVFLINVEDAGVFTYALEHLGCGISEGRPFGFLAIPRKAGFAEGALVEVNESGNRRIINVEYNILGPTLRNFGQKDEADPRTGYSRYPGNVNALFQDLATTLKLIEGTPFPGETLNLSKKNLAYREGRALQITGDRPEAQMQGVAELISGSHNSNLPHVLLYPRTDFIPAKEKYDPKNFRYMNDKTAETARQQAVNRFSLWLKAAGLAVPSYPLEVTDKLGNKETIEQFDRTMVEISPAFANREDILVQKISGGEMAEGSTLYLSGFHGQVKDLKLEGSLRIEVENETGKRIDGRVIPDANSAGKYVLSELTVNNLGLKKKLDAEGIWHGEFEEGGEECVIKIHGSGELEIRPGVTLSGAQTIEVADKELAVIAPDPADSSKYIITRYPLLASTWYYSGKLNEIDLDRPLVTLEKTRPIKIGQYSRTFGAMIDPLFLCECATLFSRLDVQHQQEMQILREPGLFDTYGSLVYRVVFKPHPEKGDQPHPYLQVQEGSKLGRAETYTSRADGVWVPARDQKASTIEKFLKGEPLKIFVGEVEDCKGPDFRGFHYIAVPHLISEQEAEIVFLIGKFNEEYDHGKKQELFDFKFNTLLRMAIKEITLSDAFSADRLRTIITECFARIPYADIFEKSLLDLYLEFIKPQLRIQTTLGI